MTSEHQSHASSKVNAEKNEGNATLLHLSGFMEKLSLRDTEVGQEL